MAKRIKPIHDILREHPDVIGVQEITYWATRWNMRGRKGRRILDVTLSFPAEDVLESDEGIPMDAESWKSLPHIFWMKKGSK